ncbi:MAG TPA: outer membrane beta-barrel protein [Gammaproteobacteria bacterium]|nr:outer membrane beta-barrel protein [Gammaproteobacteria bacterium]
MRYIICGTLALVAAPLAFAQDEIDYQYVDLAYVDNELGNIDYDGIGLRGSMPLNQDIYVAAELAVTSGDVPLVGDIDRSDLALGIGYHFPIYRNTDFVAQVDYLNIDLDELGDDDGVRLQAGVRSKVAPELELRGALQYVDVTDSDVGINLGAQYHFGSQWAAFVELNEGDEMSGYMIGARYGF